ncbi:mechanosensitive ion channel family protein [Nocardioides yefusunii]|uniref:Mechanosensitive ion channel family protein n=1 Tax=Nocardioides yefusunii TaxID=2500546 RepID=A0ABW1QVA0_9ACTN|nr:mechanosensitive ion channel family protein [Nocardioides yefusunii]
MSTALDDISYWARGTGLEIVLLVTGAVLLARFVAWYGARWIERVDPEDAETENLVRSEDAKRQHALIQLLTWVLVVVVYVLAGITLIQTLGFSLTAIVPAATVAGVAIGFGAQRIVQDLLAGFFIFAERQYGYGDLIRIAVLGVSQPVLGTVDEVSLRTTTVRTPAGEVVITPNGQIVQMTNLSRGWARTVIDVPVPSTVDVTHVSDVLRAVGRAAYDDEELRPLLLDVPTVMGVESMEVDQFQVRVVARTQPGKQFVVGRAVRELIAREFLAEGIGTAAQVNDEGTAGRDD